MKGSLTIAMLLLAVATLPAPAQQEPLRAPNISRSGQTVPKPGVIDSEKADRNIDNRTKNERRDDKIDTTICKGC